MHDKPADGPSWVEADRLAALESYGIMDTPHESDFDDIVKVAAQICGTPFALISLVDARRQWFKATVGVDVVETPREIAFCHHAIQQKGVFIVPDAHVDARFVANPLVTGDPNLRFYAGAPLETPDGLPLGTLCVLDTQPRDLTPEQTFAVSALARQVIIQLELRKALREAREAAETRSLLTLEMQHRIKNTLATVQAIVSQTLRNGGASDDVRGAITDRLVTLGKAHDLLTASTWLGASLDDVLNTAAASTDARRLTTKGPSVALDAKTALSLALAFHELVTNATKYGALSGEGGQVSVTWSVTRDVDGEVLQLVWRESGGPPVAQPTRTGFGSRLIERVLGRELNGTSSLTYDPAGLIFTLSAPLAALATS